MSRSIVVTPLKVLLAGGVALTVLLQGLVLPWLSGAVADAAPELAALRWPVLAACVAGLLCLQVVLVCTWRLLRMVEADEVFTPGSLVWVDRIVAAVAGAVLLSAGLFVHLCLVEGLGPVLLPVTLLAAVVVGTGLVLLLVVMRTLLAQAASLRADLASVI